MFIEKTVKCLHPGGFHPLVYSEFAGDPARTVVCVHGLSRNGRDFDWLAQALASEGCRVICPDLPGRGRSPNFANPAWYNYPQYMGDMITLLAALQVEAVDWVGTSMGGLLGMMIAAQKDQPIRRMVINDIGPFIPATAVAFIKQYVSCNPWYNSWDEFYVAFKLSRESFGLENEEQWEYFAKISSCFDKTQRVCLNYDVNIVGGFGDPLGDVNLWPIWTQINIPMLILRGENSTVLSIETLEQMKSSKQAESVTFPHVGHAPALMNNQQIQTVKNWLFKR